MTFKTPLCANLCKLRTLIFNSFAASILFITSDVITPMTRDDKARNDTLKFKLTTPLEIKQDARLPFPAKRRSEALQTLRFRHLATHLRQEKAEAKTEIY
jgi:hypothetical protein